MEDDRRAIYDPVLTDLENRLTTLRTEISNLQRQIRQIQVAKDNITEIVFGPAAQRSTPSRDPRKYRHLSVRWAILFMLCESEDPQSIPTIAEELKDGGIETRARDFPSNVAAVLSQMKSKSEVESAEGLWTITPVGRSAWAHISKTRLGRIPTMRTETPGVVAPGVPLAKGELR